MCHLSKDQRGEGLSHRAERLLQARLDLGEFAYTHSMEEVLQRTLDEAERLTGSSIGFFHFLAEDQLTLSLQSWSSNTLARMCSAEGHGAHYSIHEAGVWVDCVRQRRPVIHNDYASLLHKKGMPEGHAEVIRELVVPVFRGQQIVAILGIGNKPTDFGEDDVDTVSQLANLAWDLVLHKRAEASLVASQRDLARAQAVAHVGSWHLDLRQNRLTWSDEVYRIFGLRPQQFGATLEAFLERVHPDDREEVNGAYQRSVQQGDRYEIVHRVVRIDGEVRVVRERAEHSFDEHGKVIASLGTVLDITDLMETKEELRRLNAQLEQRVRERTAELEASRAELKRLNEQKNQLLGMTAHDLRNPLTVIRGYADILAQQFLGPLNPQQVKLLQRIRASSRQMVELVNDLLDVSKIEAGRLDLDLAPTDLQEVVRGAVENCQPLATPKKIELVVQEGPRLVAAVDRRRVEQVLNNLLDNAIKYSFSGARVEIGLQRSEDEAVISVKDRGRGISLGQSERLFQAFCTDGKPGTEGEKATGLGLAIARRMIQAHGGRIWVESEEGSGAHFRVALPLSGPGLGPASGSGG